MKKLYRARFFLPFLLILFFHYGIPISVGNNCLWKNSFFYGQKEKTNTDKCLDSTRLIKNRLIPLITTKTIVFTGSMTALYQTWYKDYNQSAFHFFNDNNEWLGMDKLGHGFTAYQISEYSYKSYCWTGLNHKQAMTWSAVNSLTFLTTVEIFDGFSDAWGFSYGDMLANTLGTGLSIGQKIWFADNVILFKFSYFPTRYSSLRPDLLGNSFITSALKDYNGQTYWLSANIHAFVPQFKPKWLNLALGYSADGVLGGVKNPSHYKNDPLPYFQRTRQYYLSLDVDLNRISTNKKWAKMLFASLNWIKIPFPTISYNSQNIWKFHYLYF